MLRFAVLGATMVTVGTDKTADMSIPQESILNHHHEEHVLTLKRKRNADTVIGVGFSTAKTTLVLMMTVNPS